MLRRNAGLTTFFLTRAAPKSFSSRGYSLVRNVENVRRYATGREFMSDPFAGIHVLGELPTEEREQDDAE